VFLRAGLSGIARKPSLCKKIFPPMDDLGVNRSGAVALRGALRAGEGSVRRKQERIGGIR
jgi:hypothetical protein